MEKTTQGLASQSLGYSSPNVNQIDQIKDKERDWICSMHENEKCYKILAAKSEEKKPRGVY
jgi:hypothetical protein